MRGANPFVMEEAMARNRDLEEDYEDHVSAAAHVGFKTVVRAYLLYILIYFTALVFLVLIAPLILAGFMLLYQYDVGVFHFVMWVLGAAFALFMTGLMGKMLGLWAGVLFFTISFMSYSLFLVVYLHDHGFITIPERAW